MQCYGRRMVSEATKSSVPTSSLTLQKCVTLGQSSNFELLFLIVKWNDNSTYFPVQFVVQLKQDNVCKGHAQCLARDMRQVSGSYDFKISEPYFDMHI